MAIIALCTYSKSRIFKLKDLNNRAPRNILPCSEKLDAILVVLCSAPWPPSELCMESACWVSCGKRQGMGMGRQGQSTANPLCCRLSFPAWNLRRQKFVTSPGAQALGGRLLVSLLVHNHNLNPQRSAFLSHTWIHTSWACTLDHLSPINCSPNNMP